MPAMALRKSIDVTTPRTLTTWPRRSGTVSAGVVSTFACAIVESALGLTKSAAFAPVERNCASVAVTGMLFAPGVVAGATGVLKEKMLSPAVTSPFEPLSKSVCVALPPMELRFAVTAMPVLVGPVPGVTVAVRSVVPPWATGVGVKVPATAKPLQSCDGEPVLRGFGAPVAKSEAFWFESVQPPAARRTALVLLGAGVGPVPSKQFAVDAQPTKSAMFALLGQGPVCAVVTLASRTLPAVADMLIVPVASGVGSGVVPPAPAASWTR